MIKTTWTCDRCAEAQDTPEQMWEVAIKLRSVDSRHYASKPEDKRTELWCRKCCAELWCRKCCEVYPTLGLTASKPDGEPAVSAPTCEDLLREIIRFQSRLLADD